MSLGFKDYRVCLLALTVSRTEQLTQARKTTYTCHPEPGAQIDVHDVYEFS